MSKSDKKWSFLQAATEMVSRHKELIAQTLVLGGLVGVALKAPIGIAALTGVIGLRMLPAIYRSGKDLIAGSSNGMTYGAAAAWVIGTAGFGISAETVARYTDVSSYYVGSRNRVQAETVAVGNAMKQLVFRLTDGFDNPAKYEKAAAKPAIGVVSEKTYELPSLWSWDVVVPKVRAEMVTPKNSHVLVGTDLFFTVDEAAAAIGGAEIGVVEAKATYKRQAYALRLAYDAKDSAAPLNVPNEYKGKDIKVIYPDIPWRTAPAQTPAASPAP